GRGAAAGAGAGCGAIATGAGAGAAASWGAAQAASMPHSASAGVRGSLMGAPGWERRRRVECAWPRERSPRVRRHSVWSRWRAAAPEPRRRSADTRS
ncbi:MAG: hypothetical protein FJX64_08225, partial [Alphaproteobacteria bacterium]|nr:hypothetical protein [Alphaproteobacteria bacterium]